MKRLNEIFESRAAVATIMCLSFPLCLAMAEQGDYLQAILAASFIPGAAYRLSYAYYTNSKTCFPEDHPPPPRLIKQQQEPS